MSRSVHGCQIPHRRRESWLHFGVPLKVLVAGGIKTAALLCSTTFALSGPTPANASLLQLFTVIYFPKLPFAVTDFAFLWQVQATRLSLPSICEGRTVALVLISENSCMVELRMMTAMCPARGHSCQSMCLGFSPDQIRPTVFPLPKPTKRFSMLPSCRTTNRMSGIESPGWRLLTNGGFKRRPTGSEMAGWRIAAVSLDNFVRILSGPLTRDPSHLVFLGATSCSKKTLLSSQVLLKPSDGLIVLSPVTNVFAFFLTRNTRLVSLWVSPRREGTLPWAANVTTLFCGLRANSTSPLTPATPGTNALTLRRPWA